MGSVPHVSFLIQMGKSRLASPDGHTGRKTLVLGTHLWAKPFERKVTSSGHRSKNTNLRRGKGEKKGEQNVGELAFITPGKQDVPGHEARG